MCGTRTAKAPSGVVPSLSIHLPPQEHNKGVFSAQYPKLRSGGTPICVRLLDAPSPEMLALDFSDVDECAGVSCFNGGTCVDLVDDWECVCEVGYTGVQCQTGKYQRGSETEKAVFVNLRETVTGTGVSTSGSETRVWANAQVYTNGNISHTSFSSLWKFAFQTLTTVTT